MIPKDMQIDLNSVRRRLERKEESLSPYATRSIDAVREIPELPSATRTEFQRDRDRVIHANSFRRLKHKSQVFVAPQGDHFTTRLTHVIEVSQVGRSIARGLNLNEDLVEAIGLGHDLGMDVGHQRCCCSDCDRCRHTGCGGGLAGAGALCYTPSPTPRDGLLSPMPSSA